MKYLTVAPSGQQGVGHLTVLQSASLGGAGVGGGGIQRKSQHASGIYWIVAPSGHQGSAHVTVLQSDSLYGAGVDCGSFVVVGPEVGPEV